ncbi:MAG: DUF4177 domain-containing protein [Defluviitaleaceae bacterium]|nr:DUF4177 domain-containing protein [Defluviitaleaceae bacterium]
MKKFEYKVVRVATGFFGSMDEEIEKTLNEYAEESWELVAQVTNENMNPVIITFKREK